MTRKVTYWVSTGLLAALSVFAAFTYLSGSPQAVQGFAHVDIRSNYALFLGSPNSLARSPSSSPAWPSSRSGLCRIHIRVDLGICCALSCERWPESIHAVILLLLLAISM